jgi:hypothetical protein
MRGTPAHEGQAGIFPMQILECIATCMAAVEEMRRARRFITRTWRLREFKSAIAKMAVEWAAPWDQSLEENGEEYAHNTFKHGQAPAIG